ncbi:hypothetical protein CCHR01_18392 [Colletotrichum chrysophilum]|uniref:Secreted protein n=1 Tax=Colletotrichum chrysophilum TaxID=1836956 RepID=A0AAD9A075_9PEZI|nr:hypothetical protein CCHR01_18392 [Colletotrichum chrysophilum]
MSLFSLPLWLSGSIVRVPGLAGLVCLVSQICQPPPKTIIHVVLKPSASTGVGGHAQEPHGKASEWRVAGTRNARLARPGDDVHLPPPRSGAEETASSIAMLNVECGTGGKVGIPLTISYAGPSKLQARRVRSAIPTPFNDPPSVGASRFNGV